MSRKKKEKKTRECSYCGRIHPRGKNAKRKAREQGWEGCSSAKIKKEKGDAGLRAKARRNTSEP